VLYLSDRQIIATRREFGWNRFAYFGDRTLGRPTQKTRDRAL
jgi:hypothetical protein